MIETINKESQEVNKLSSVIFILNMVHHQLIKAILPIIPLKIKKIKEKFYGHNNIKNKSKISKTSLSLSKNTQMIYIEPLNKLKNRQIQ
jgi:hypothetical protein